MSAPNAPVPLVDQVSQNGGSIVVTVPLQSLGPAPGFTVGAAGYNNGNPTATFTFTLPNAPAAGAGGVASSLPGALTDILARIEDMWAAGYFVAT